MINYFDGNLNVLFQIFNIVWLSNLENNKYLKFILHVKTILYIEL